MLFIVVVADGARWYCEGREDGEKEVADSAMSERRR